jgi:hypothetical protein
LATAVVSQLGHEQPVAGERTNPQERTRGSATAPIVPNEKAGRPAFMTEQPALDQNDFDCNPFSYATEDR